MMKRLLILVVLLTFGISFALAQEYPPQVDTVLADLNTRLGTQLTLEDLDTWTWNEQVFGDTSLGCPQPDQAYAQVTTRGYQVIFEYQGVTYDYRIATDGSFFILCGSTGDNQTTTPTAVAPVTAVPTTLPAVTTTPVAGECLMPVRLEIGETARVAVGLPSNLRADADINAADVGDVQPGETFTVLDGPVCAGDMNWWQVETASATGWIAEGQNGLYFIEPIPQPLPANLTPLTEENLPELTELTRIEGNFAGEMAWSPDGATIAVVFSNPVQPGIWLYEIASVDTVLPSLLSTEAFPTALEFSPDGLWLAVGYENGTLEFFEVESGDSLFSTQAYTGAIRDLRFNPAGTVITSIGEDNTVKFWGVPATQ